MAFERDSTFPIDRNGTPDELKCFGAPCGEAVIFEKFEVVEGYSMGVLEIFWVAVVSSEGEELDFSFAEFCVQFFTEGEFDGGGSVKPNSVVSEVNECGVLDFVVVEQGEEIGPLSMVVT